MLKKQSLILLFLLAISMIVTFQNCGTTSPEGGLFGSSCSNGGCGADPNALKVSLDTSVLTSGVLKISANPSAGFSNLRLTGTCNNGGYDKTLIKAKFYQCIGSSTQCTTLKYLKSTPCGADGRYEIASTVTTLTPGTHKLFIEIVGFNEFSQEVYGRNSKLAAITVSAQNTIKPPVLSSFTGTNFWSQDKLYYFPSSTEKVTLDGYITGFCDYTAGGNNIIYVKLAIKGSSTYKLISGTPVNCTPIVEGSTIGTSPYRNGRTGYFMLDNLSIYMAYTGDTFITCDTASSDYANCINNTLNSRTNRIVSLGLFQRDVGFNYDVYGHRNLILHFTGSQYGKGWLVEALVEMMKRVKKSFNFSNSEVTGNLDGTQSSNNDFTKANTILTSHQDLIDPLITSGANYYGYGTRKYIVSGLLGATEDISTSIYPNQANDLYFLGSSATIPYKNMAVVNLNGVLICGLNSTVSDPISGVVGAYSTDPELERIALCLTHRYMNGIWDKPYAEYTYKMVNEGVTFLNNNANCFSRGGQPYNSGECSTMLEFLQAAAKIKARRMPSNSFGNASDDQLKYFGNAMTQYYINKIMYALAYRNTDYGGENEIFADIFTKVYPEITDVSLRRTLYPDEYNYVGSSARFGGSRSTPFPQGSAKEAY